jgi:hypothetical protein
LQSTSITCANGNRALGFVKRNLKRCPRHIKANEYKTLVQPKVEYAATIWDPHQLSHTQYIEKVQHCAARFTMNDYKRDSSVTQMLEHLQWEPLDLRHMTFSLVMMYRIVHDIVAIPATTYLIPVPHQRQTHPYTFQRYQSSHAYFLRSYFSLGPSSSGTVYHPQS